MGGGIVSAIAKGVISALGGLWNRWITAKKAAHAKAKADALGTREESAERAERAEYNIDTVAKKEKEKPRTDSDESKIDEIESF